MWKIIFKLMVEENLLRQRFVLDTSVFITDEIRRGDEQLADTLSRLLDLISKARLSLNISCHMPPSVYRELKTILGDREVPDEIYSNINTWIIKKNPKKYEISVPAEIIYKFIDEMSERINRGLRISEDAVREAEKKEGETIEDHEYKTEIDNIISKLRGKYRKTLRQGVLDSKEDFDLLILAKELDACIVTEDQGIIGWADDFGLRYLKGREFPNLIEKYLEKIEKNDY